jgi:ATP-binding protein involved in chromosome partitioning
MSENELLKKIGQIKNPVSGETLLKEDRLGEYKFEETTCQVVYKRDGIAPAQKREIEDQMYDILMEKYEEDNISIKSISENSSDVLGGSAESKPQAQAAPAQQAQLQVGHGPSAPQKKRVPGVDKVIAVSSGKGGVGKSTVSVNLALALSKLGAKVGVLDADIYGPSVPMLLGKREAKPAASEDKKILPVEAHGLGFISFGLFISESDPVIWRGPMLGGVLNQFLFDVKWGELDYLIIDLPPGTGDMQLSLIQATQIDGTVVVSTPQDVALLDSKKGLNMFKQVNTPILGMVENMSYFTPPNSNEKYHIFGEGGVEKAAGELEVPFLGGIPIEMEMRKGADSGNPYMADNNNEGRPGWESYLEVATKLKKTLNGGGKKTGFLGKLFNK